MDWLKLFGRRKVTEDQYETEKALAVSGNIKKRLTLAKDSNTHKEILFYLAEHDPDEKVRMAVARNSSTPLHASTTLAIDSNQDVRLALAGRLVKLLPDLSVDRQSQLYAYAVQSLGTLALDEVLKIRKSLSSALKDHALAPPSVALQLAKDIEREVSEPILRLCTALKDDDLVEILSSHPESWAAEAVAQRPKLTARVSKAVIETGNAIAGKLLLKNEGAEIDNSVLEVIIERAREFPEWHEPLVKRHHLPPDMAVRLARFIDARIRKILLEKGNYDAATIEMVADVTKRRMQTEESLQKSNTRNETAAQRVKKLYTEGRLNEEIISDALALRDKEFVAGALAVLCGAKVKSINKIFTLKKPKLVCAVCWKAGLSMRFALRLQQEMAQIHPKELVYPKGGSDYPMDKEELRFQLDLIGIG
jgi:uncharacterized protein (DUF2336 family)